MIRINMLPNEKKPLAQKRPLGRFYSWAVISVAAVLVLGWYVKDMAKIPGSKTVDESALESPGVKGEVMVQNQASIVEGHVPKTVQEIDTKASDLRDALIRIEAWRMAWSERDMDGYFAAYAKNFIPPKRFDSIEEWKRYKRRVILAKSFIHVSLGDIKAELLESGRRVTVRFLQEFRSNSFSGENEKILILENGDNGWKIIREISK